MDLIITRQSNTDFNIIKIWKCSINISTITNIIN